MLNNSVKKIAQQSINMQHNLKIKIYSFKNYKLYLYVFNSRFLKITYFWRAE